MLQPGDVFADDYEIRANLGSGGFATVYLAFRLSTSSEVALKVLRLEDQTAQERFTLEARLLQRLDDPAIVKLLDHGVQKGEHYLALEFIEGPTLRELIDREGPLGPRRTVRILTQVASAVAVAHALGALHRDLKPDNVMLTEPDFDAVKVLDFGIAKIVGDHAMLSVAGPMTEIGKTVGTPRYMSPEALCAEKAGPESDVFSMGMLAFEMLTGERALPGLSGNELIGRMVDNAPITLPENADAPDELRQLVNDMLRKDTNDRVESAARVLVRLGALPEYMAKTRVMLPDEFTHMHRGPDVPEDTTTINDEEDHTTTRRRKRTTSPEIRAAAQQLREDAEARGAPRRLGEPPPDEEWSEEQEAQPRRTHASVEAPDDPLPELDRPPVRRRKLNIDARQVLGFGMLGLALLFTVGYLVGVVGVEVSIVEGHPLECGFGKSSLHIEKHFVVLGAEVVQLDQQIRCTTGPR